MTTPVPQTTTMRLGSASTPAPAGSTGSVAMSAAAAPEVADMVATAVLGCPDVAGLSGGQFGEVATYLPGRRVEGVRLTTDRVAVHVVARFGAPLHQIADRVRRTVAPVTAGRPVDVTFDDITAGELTPTT